MSQRFGLYDDLTVRENIDFYADLYGVPRGERPAGSSGSTRSRSSGRSSTGLPAQLSGGMKQKLSLCCALIHEPDVLLLDEPTFGVDPISRRELWLILHEMVHQGVTVLVSTAYLDEAERCDRVALLDQGRIIALDTPAALQRSLPGDMLADSRRWSRAGRSKFSAPCALRQRGAVRRYDSRPPRLKGARLARASRTALRNAGLAVLESTTSSRRSKTCSSNASHRAHHRRDMSNGGRGAQHHAQVRRVHRRRRRVVRRARGRDLRIPRVRTARARRRRSRCSPGSSRQRRAAGSVVGLDLLTQARVDQGRIGYMSQLFSLYADLTVDENIRFFAGLYGVYGPRLDERREWVLDMSGLAEHRPSTRRANFRSAGSSVSRWAAR